MTRARVILKDWLRTRCVLHLIHRYAVPPPLKGKALIELPYKGKTTIGERAGLVVPDRYR